jgi:hypothetical protein
MSAKDILTLAMSAGALIVSGITLYFNLLQTTDDLAVVAAVIPELSMREDGKLQFADANVSVMFVNAGNRPAAITSLFVSMSQLRRDGLPTGEECLDEMVYEDHTKSYSTDFVPLVLKEKEVTTRQLRLVPKGKEPDLAFPVARFNKGEKSFPIVMCLNIDAAAISNTEMSRYQIVQRWTVSKNSPNDSYDVTRDGPKTTKPLPIYYRRGTIFSN